MLSGPREEGIELVRIDQKINDERDRGHHEHGISHRISLCGHALSRHWYCRRYSPYRVNNGCVKNSGAGRKTKSLAGGVPVFRCLIADESSLRVRNMWLLKHASGNSCEEVAEIISALPGRAYSSHRDVVASILGMDRRCRKARPSMPSGKKLGGNRARTGLNDKRCEADESVTGVT
jgi:hypothetical protein